MMLLRVAVICGLILVGTGLAPARAIAESSKHSGAGVVHESRLIYLDEEARFRVWSLKDGSYDEASCSRLAKEPITHLAVGGDQLWGAGKRTLFAWDAKEASWKKRADFNPEGETLEAIVLVGSTPVLVFPKKVKAPTLGKTFRFPRLREFIGMDSLPILAVCSTDSMLWVGTDLGEWGGHLVGLELETGRWHQYYDSLHYVTGIARDAADEVVVSWSMSHFSAKTLIRIHHRDGLPRKSYRELQSRYFQTIAFNAFDRTLYGVDGNNLVSIKDGLPLKIVELQGQIFERERHAIGVAPGLSGLIATGAKELVIVPKHGLPAWFRDGMLTGFRLP